MDAEALHRPPPAHGPVLAAVLTLGFAVLALALAAAPQSAPLVAGALAAGLVAVVVGSSLRPSHRLIGLLALSIAAVGADAGADPLEIAFGVALVAYLGGWTGATLLGGRRFLRTWPDVAMLAFLVIGGIGGTLFALLQGNMGLDLRSDILNVMALALYFPAREVCVRSERGPEIVAGSLLAIGIAATLISATRLYGMLSGATVYYEVVDARVYSGEVQAMAALIIASLWASASPTWTRRLGLLAIAGIALVGLVIARSRSQWIASAFGLVAAGAVLPPRLLSRYALSIVLGSVAAVLGGIALLGQRLALFATGVIQRLVTISSALTTDISVINRYAENAAGWAAVAESPLVGHGWGAPVARVDLISGTLTVWGFLHNGFAWVAHKTGFLGLVTFVGAMVGIGVRAAWAARTGTLPDEHRALAAAGAGLVAALLLLAYPANPFAILDQMIVVSLSLALASGVALRNAT